MRTLACLSLVAASLALGACAATPRPATDDVAAQQAEYLQASRREHTRRVDWQPVKTFRFDTPAALDDLRVIAGEWEVRDGALHAVEGEGTRTLLLTPANWPSVRITFDVVLHPDADGQIGDIGIRLNADPETGAFARGYAVILAQYRNQATVFYRSNIPYARTEWSPIVPGQRHRVAIEWTGRHMRAWVDDRVVLDAWDRGEPLPLGDGETWLGLHTWQTHMTLDNLVIHSDG